MNINRMLNFFLGIFTNLFNILIKKQLVKIFISILLWGIIAVTSIAQVRIEVIKHPELLLEDKRLYIATNFNNWNPGSPDYELKKDFKGTYYIELPDTLTYFEYKFTQGSWALVEGSDKGGSRVNRVYESTKETDPKLIKVTIESWEKPPSYKFIVRNIPKNTPEDATLYVSGNFNNWNPANPAYKLHKQEDGSYRLLVYSDLSRLEFKFTRGSWKSVEGRESGKARPNRVALKEGITQDVEVNILSWEDLTGTFNLYSFYDIVMLFAGLQGILFIIAITGIQDYNRIANRWLISLLGIVSILIIIRVLWQHRDIADAYPKLQLVPDFVIFIFAPIFHFYIRRLLFRSEKITYKWIYHFIPAIIQFVLTLPYFFMDTETFKIKIVNKDLPLQTLFIVIGSIGFLYNLFYVWLNLKTVRIYKERYQTQYSYEQNLQYLNDVIIIQIACLVMWFATGILFAANRYFSNYVSFESVEKSADVIWLIFSIITYYLGYYAMRQPEVFRLPQPGIFKNDTTDLISVDISEQDEVIGKDSIHEALVEVEDSGTPIVTASLDTANKLIAKPIVEVKQVDENIRAMAKKVDDYLRKNKTFTNPDLSLSDLASKMKIQPHVLSKVINDGFGKNFFDFINGYRVEEFKRLAHDPRFKHHTFVSLAFEVGFNSKTAFNRSFKKLTNQTPREFFSNSHIANNME